MIVNNRKTLSNRRYKVHNHNNKAKKTKVAFKGQLLFDPYILIPTMAAYSLFYKASKIDSERSRDTFIANNLFTASMSTLFANLNKLEAITASTFPILSCITLIAHANTKKTKRGKARTFAKDASALTCGLISKNLGNRLLGNIQRIPSGPIGFIYETCSFLVGALMAAPFISTFVNDHITERIFPKKNSQINLQKLYNDQSPYPAIIDSYNVTRFTSPRLFDVTKEDVTDIDEE